MEYLFPNSGFLTISSLNSYIESRFQNDLSFTLNKHIFALTPKQRNVEQNHSINYYSVNNFDQVDEELLEDDSIDTCGNLVHAFKGNLYFATGELGNIVNGMTFKTPVRQIVSNKKLFIRSMEGVHMVEEGGFETITFNQHIEHLALNQKLPSKASFIGNASITSWDIETSSTLEYLNFQEINDEVRSCEYGIHPFDLFVATNNSLKLYDARSKDTNSVSIYTGSVHAFDCHHSNLQTVIIGQDSTILMDYRYSRRPILEWSFNNSYETEWIIKYLHDDCFYTCGKKSAEVLVYEYGGQPPSSKTVHNLNSYYHHDHNHLDSRYIDPFCHKPENWDEYCQSRIIKAPWVPLSGVEVLKVGDSYTCFQLTKDGSLYATVSGNIDFDIDLGVNFDIDFGLPRYFRIDDIRIHEDKVRDSIQTFAEKLIPDDEEASHDVHKTEIILQYFAKRIPCNNRDLPSLISNLRTINAPSALGDCFEKRGHEYIGPRVKLPSLSRFRSADIESLISKIPESYRSIHLPNPNILEENIEILEADIKLDSVIVIPRSSTTIIDVNGTPQTHTSTLRSSLLLQDLSLSGTESWINSRWDRSDSGSDYDYDSQGESVVSQTSISTLRSRKRGGAGDDVLVKEEVGVQYDKYSGIPSISQTTSAVAPIGSSTSNGIHSIQQSMRISGKSQPLKPSSQKSKRKKGF